jgi:hypothetical protein
MGGEHLQRAEEEKQRGAERGEGAGEHRDAHVADRIAYPCFPTARVWGAPTGVPVSCVLVALDWVPSCHRMAHVETSGLSM